MVVPGAALALERHPDVNFLLYGNEDRVEPFLLAYPELADRSRIVHTDTVVEMQDKPSQAVRRGRGSSMWLSIEAVQKGEADFAVSAGNTGALMAMAKLILKTMPGIERPAIAGQWPTVARPQHRARPRRQYRRHRAPARRLRADGRGHGAGDPRRRAAARRPAQHRRRGDQGHRGGAPGACLAQGDRPADRLSRLRRGRPDRPGRGRRGRGRGLCRQYRAQDGGGHGQADGDLCARGPDQLPAGTRSARSWPRAGCAS